MKNINVQRFIRRFESARFGGRLLFNICFVLFAGLALTSCGGGKSHSVEVPPTITLPSGNTYTVKVGKTITISPTYQHADKASFAWKENGKVISSSPSLSYSSNESGEKFISLSVTNSAGTAKAEIKINVVELMIPVISYYVPAEGITIATGESFKFSPTVENATGATYEWTINGNKVGSAKDYTFSSSTNGTYNFKFTAKTEDGSASVSFKVIVANPADIPFKWSFEKETYYLSQGRKIRIMPLNVQNEFDATYSFSVNGTSKQSGSKKYFIFEGTTQGSYTVTVTMTNSYRSVSKNLTVEVCPPEGTYKRTSASGVRLNKVYEFLAAPGQFVNENYSASTMAEAVAYAESRLITGNGELYLSLGGWGGSVVVGFDHSIINDGGYNIQIRGNSFDGSSEPGIVWVMQDENGDGLPNDTWYELKGSDYSTETLDYAVTYYKPSSAKQPVQWTDSKGVSGSIDYMGGYHTQDFYYPNWVSTKSYTIYGSLLKSKTTYRGGIWINGSFDWGYADNWSKTDRIFPSIETCNHFKISNAVDWEGKAVNLQYVDFVKVQTGVNAKAGIIGEVSTEVQDFRDYNLMK